MDLLGLVEKKNKIQRLNAEMQRDFGVASKRIAAVLNDMGIVSVWCDVAWDRAMGPVLQVHFYRWNYILGTEGIRSIKVPADRLYDNEYILEEARRA